MIAPAKNSGRQLAEALGLTIIGVEGHDLKGPCVVCDSSDAFRVHEDTGVGYCHSCEVSLSPLKLAANVLGDPDAAWRILEQVGLAEQRQNGQAASEPVDPLILVARQKSVPPEALRAFGAKVVDGTVELPCYGPDGQPCSSFTMKPGNGKGLFAKDKKAGVFLPGRLPQPGETWHVSEGPKDPAALHSLGLLAAGLPTSSLPARFARLFRDVHVVLIPDRDGPGEAGAQKTARRLHSLAQSIRVATLPTEFKETKGDDVRDILKKPDGRELLLQAIADAKPWQPASMQGPVGDAASVWTPEGRTDAANADRFVRAHGDNARWCDPHDTWYVFNGKQWNPDRERKVESLQCKLAADLWSEVRGASEAGKAEEKLIAELVRYAKTSNSANGIRNGLNMARPFLPLLPEAFDADPFSLNCPNGTLDLRTGSLRPHRREDFLTKICPTAFNPDAPSMVWDRFLEKIFNFDQKLIDFVRRFAGYCLTGDVREQLLAILHGDGSNGKSTFLNGYMVAVGPDYTMQSPRGFLMASKNERHLTEQYDLKGRRFMAAVETGDGRRIDEELMKSLTGGEPIRARKMYADHEEFKPTHKIVVCTNHKPSIRGTDHAVWRRIALVPFTVKFWNPDKGETGPAELMQDKTLPTKLAAEAEGILAWAVRGCLEWQSTGLRMPDVVRAATEEYRTKEDVVGRFVTAWCERVDGEKTPFKVIYEALEAWCEESGDNMPSPKAVATWLERNGFQREKTRTRPYCGIRVLTELEIKGARNDETIATDF